MEVRSKGKSIQSFRHLSDNMTSFYKGIAHGCHSIWSYDNNTMNA